MSVPEATIGRSRCDVRGFGFLSGMSFKLGHLSQGYFPFRRVHRPR